MQTDGSEGINILTLQGRIGLLLSTMIVMAPPMAAFLQGTLGQCDSYSYFDIIGSKVSTMDQ